VERVLVGVAAAAVGGLAGLGSYALGTQSPTVAACVGISFAVVVLLSARHPDTVYEAGAGRGFRYGRWSAASTAFLLGVAVVGLGPWLPIAPGLRLSLGLLVVGSGYAMWLFGVSYARAKRGE
jgi:hypothetical protein